MDRTREPPDDRQAGFTLIELLVVIAILGLLIGLVAPAALQQLGSSRQKVAQQTIARLGSFLEVYRLDVGSYPTSEQGLAVLINRPSGVRGWNGPYIRGDQGALDPWGNAFVYRSPSQRPGREYDLISLGSDGRPGGQGEAADVAN